MDRLNTLLVLVVLLVPSGIGVYAVAFSRQISLVSLRWRKAVLKIDFSESDVRRGQFFALILGAVVLFFGVLALVRALFH